MDVLGTLDDLAQAPGGDAKDAAWGDPQCTDRGGPPVSSGSRSSTPYLPLIVLYVNRGGTPRADKSNGRVGRRYRSPW